MISPCIAFSGNCREALEFYKTAFGCEDATTLPYGEYVPEGTTAPPPDLAQWIMHAEMTICGTNFWFSDEVSEPVRSGNQIALSAKVATANEAQRIYDCLSRSATVTLPPTETFYCNFHAGLTDKYGVCWNIVSEESPNAAQSEELH